MENINNIWTAQAGTVIPILFRFQNSFSNYVVTVGVGADNDQNPYNNEATNIVNYNLTNIDSLTFWTNFWTFASGDNGKYAYAKITDYKGFVRYYYLSQPFQALPPPNNPPNVLLSPQLLADGKFTAILSGETGRTYVIEASTNFVSWTQLATNTLTSDSAPFIDPSASGLARRFYQALAQ